jgi:hypothetical protein
MDYPTDSDFVDYRKELKKIYLSIGVVVILALVLFAGVICYPAYAADICGNMTFSTLGQGGAEDVMIYVFDGTNQTLMGQWNTSSPDVPSYCGDVNVVIRPSASSQITNPATFLRNAFDYVASNIIYIIIIIFLALLFTRRG